MKEQILRKKNKDKTVVSNLGFTVDLPGELKKYPDTKVLSLEILI